MATVHLARQVGPSGFLKPCVVKTIAADVAGDPTFRAMFLEEARISARLHHPHIVQTFDFGEADGSPYIALELVDGANVGKLMRRVVEANELLPVRVCVETAMTLLDALDHAHGLTDGEGRSLNLVHRDVSPQNILISRGGVVKLTDFGIARHDARKTKTMLPMTKGKPGYMALEQSIPTQTVDRRTDIFATGIVLAEMICAERVMPKGILALGLNALGPRIEAMFGQHAHLSKELRGVVLAMTALQPDDRPESARAARALLQGVSNDLTGREPLSTALEGLFARYIPDHVSMETQALSQDPPEEKEAPVRVIEEPTRLAPPLAEEGLPADEPRTALLDLREEATTRALNPFAAMLDADSGTDPDEDPPREPQRPRAQPSEPLPFPPPKAPSPAASQPSPPPERPAHMPGRTPWPPAPAPSPPTRTPWPPAHTPLRGRQSSAPAGAISPSAHAPSPAARTPLPSARAPSETSRVAASLDHRSAPELAPPRGRPPVRMAIAVLVLFGLGGLVYALTGARRTASRGGLEVRSEPPGAEIILDGRPSGFVTPHTFADLAAGVVRARVQLDGHRARPDEQEVAIVAGAPAVASFELRKTLRFRLETEPEGAAVALDGAPLDRVTPLDLPELVIGTTATLAITRSGFVPVRLALLALPTTPTTARMRLEPGTPIDLTSSPPGAELSVDGVRRGITPARALILADARPSRLDLELNGFRSWSAVIRPGDLAGRRLDVQLRPASPAAENGPGNRARVEAIQHEVQEAEKEIHALRARLATLRQRLGSVDPRAGADGAGSAGPGAASARDRARHTDETRARIQEAIDETLARLEVAELRRTNAIQRRDQLVSGGGAKAPAR